MALTIKNGQAASSQADMFGRQIDPYQFAPGDLYMHDTGHVTRQASGQGNPFMPQINTLTYTPEQWAEQLKRDESAMQGLAPIASIAMTAAGLPDFISRAAGGGLLGSMASGATMGGISSALGGSNVLKGALAGGIGGGVSTGLNDALTGAGVDSGLSRGISSATASGVRSAVKGGDFGQGLLGGALSSLGGAAGSELARYSGVDNPVGMGLIGQLPGFMTGMFNSPQQAKMPDVKTRSQGLPVGAPPGARKVGNINQGN